MATSKVLRKAARLLPGNVRSLARDLYYRDRHWAHPALKNFGTVQDLYYWIADGKLDTLLLIQNYFSALYPALNTETTGTISIYSKDGLFLGSKNFSIPHCGCAKLRVSGLREELQIPPDHSFGTVEVNIAIPEDVMEHTREETPLYFWDRFYIGYTNSEQQACFVHGVDKTHIYHEGSPDATDWYKKPKDHPWAPEIPIDMDDYHKLSVILINRTSGNAKVTLILSDTENGSLSLEAQIPAKGVHRFELNRERTAGLVSTEMRMRVQGMATQFGRPVVFKEFPNGAISAMHC